MAIIGAVIVIGFWLIVSHNMKIVPSRRQWFGDYRTLFVLAEHATYESYGGAS
jgi:F0F1-type ATP synthase membrane subunit a